MASGALAFLFLFLRPAACDEVVAVLSSRHKPYVEALAGFEESFGRAVPVLDAPDTGLASDTKVVLAFGGRAASLAYPARVTVVYCLAPGLLLESRRAVKIEMLPEPEALLDLLREVQPGLGRLGVFWLSRSFDRYLRELREAGRGRGVRVVAHPLADADALPEALRGIAGRVDALWVPPDPVLLTPSNIELIKHFAWEKDVPFFAPTAALLSLGAAAAVDASFLDIGRVAGETTRRVLEGRRTEGRVYPGKSSLSVNTTAAGESGLRIQPEVLKKHEPR
jgi:putative tryptophan/tyrosine transport system substrate-binding protein